MSLTETDVHFDPYDREIYADPYPTFRRLRDEAPLYYNAEYDFYAVSRFADSERVLVDRSTFISSKGGALNLIGAQIPRGMFIYEDPPTHTIHRALVSRVFTPKQVNAIEGEIRDFCVRTVEGLVGNETFDFVRDFAAEIPMRVIGMLVGIPDEAQARIRDAFHHDMHAGTADRSKEPFAGLLDMSEWMFGEFVDWTLQHPSDDVMTQLLSQEFEDESGTTRRLRRDEVLIILSLIVSGGSDTTARLIGWAGSLLGNHPDQRRELVEDPGLIPGAVDEILRYESPSYHNCRIATKEVEFYGQTVPEGSIVAVMPGSANHDERRFSDPESFDIHRNSSRVLSFGFGPHLCLGANLARVEGRIALEELLKRIPEWTADFDSAELTAGVDTRGWDSLPVAVSR